MRTHPIPSSWWKGEKANPEIWVLLKNKYNVTVIKMEGIILVNQEKSIHFNITKIRVTDYSRLKGHKSVLYYRTFTHYLDANIDTKFSFSFAQRFKANLDYIIYDDQETNRQYMNISIFIPFINLLHTLIISKPPSSSPFL